MKRTLVATDSPYGSIVGFSRAVRVGNFIAIAGTAPLDQNGNTVGVGDPAAQTRQCFAIVARALAEAGATMKDIVRTRLLLTRIEDWEAVAKVHGATFRGIQPVATVVEVKRFINADWLIEVEVDAIVAEDTG